MRLIEHVAIRAYAMDKGRIIASLTREMLQERDALVEYLAGVTLFGKEICDRDPIPPFLSGINQRKTMPNAPYKKFLLEVFESRFDERGRYLPRGAEHSLRLNRGT